MKFSLRLTTAMMVAFLIGWNLISAIDNEKFLSKVRDAQTIVDATADAQDFAMPLVALSEQLARENAMFTQVIDRARDIVTEKEIELAATKDALNSSIELLQEQIVENNHCVDEIRSLERTIRDLNAAVDRLMKKIPDAVDAESPYDSNYNN